MGDLTGKYFGLCPKGCGILLGFGHEPDTCSAASSPVVSKTGVQRGAIPLWNLGEPQRIAGVKVWLDDERTHLMYEAAASVLTEEQPQKGGDRHAGVSRAKTDVTGDSPSGERANEVEASHPQDERGALRDFAIQVYVCVRSNFQNPAESFEKGLDNLENLLASRIRGK